VDAKLGQRSSLRYQDFIAQDEQVNRREFIKLAGVAAPLAGVPALWGTDAGPEIAFTFDDPRTEGEAGLSWQQVNERMLAALAARKIKATLFVCGKRVDSEDGRSLVTEWDRAGHGIGNHSYSHLNFNASGRADAGEANVTLADFEADALRNEPLIRSYAHFTRLFRYPFFKEGDTAEKRDGMRSFLRQHSYRIGRTTIDASDWAIDARLGNRLKADPKADPTAYGDFFLRHIWERAQFYDSLAQRVLNRPVRHTLLLHHSALNALFLDRLMAMFIAKGWRPVDASRAYADPVYDLQPRILPAGESLIWALAKESGKFERELRYPGEDDVYENPKMGALKL
jgi:peptidoglycan/xylan/chitin deacetylase (PgdA/CDA1 family)